jgi:hypothetical protein
MTDLGKVPWLADTARMSRSVFVEHFVEAAGHSTINFEPDPARPRRAPAHRHRSSCQGHRPGGRPHQPELPRTPGHHFQTAGDGRGSIRRAWLESRRASKGRRAEHRNTGTGFHPARHARPDRVAHGSSRTLLGISVEGAWCHAAFAQQLLRGWCAGCSHSRPSTRPARGIS